MLRRFHPHPASFSFVRHCHQSSFDNQHQQNLVNNTSSSPLLTHLQNPQQRHQDLYERAERDLQIPIVKALRAAMRREYSSSKKLASVPTTDTAPAATASLSLSFVSSAVLATPASCNCGSVCTCPPILKFTGINSALHRQIHQNNFQQQQKRNINDDHHDQHRSNLQDDTFSSSSSCSSSAPAAVVVMKGLLKGCAEQNALGAFAASGNHFEQVRGIVICSLRVNSTAKLGCDDRDCDARSDEKDQQQQQPQQVEENETCCFPCTACRNYLSKVHRFVSMRHSHQKLKLSCISLKLEIDEDEKSEVNENNNNNSSIKNNQRKTSTSVKKTKTVSLDCVNGWDTSYKELSFRL